MSSLQLLLSKFYPGKQQPFGSPSFHPLGRIWYPLPQQLAQLHANEIVYVLSGLAFGLSYSKAQVNRSQEGVPKGHKSFTYLHDNGTKQVANVVMHAWLAGETKPFPTCIQVGERPTHARDWSAPTAAEPAILRCWGSDSIRSHTVALPVDL